MGRVKLKFPDENPLFTCTIPIRVGDLNYGNHVGNDSILSIVHEARMQMLHDQGYSEMDAAGVGLIMADVMIAYKGESFYGDILAIKIYAEELTGYSFDLLYRISASRNNNITDIAHAKTGMVCFDYSSRKIAAMPEKLKVLLEGDK
ncbi:MAG: thioesterase [Flavipsychrobacter sp.]|jgi:YbgC/YbaW family acyl-CoA thioester hydrolase|nr:thioesterase [Flavipsychrobacter sp.]